MRSTKANAPRNCGRRYTTRIAAMLALADVEAKDRPTRAERSVVSCGRCLGWHLSRKPQRSAA